MSDETKLDLEAIEARANAATPGPWEPRYAAFDPQNGIVQGPAPAGQPYGTEVLGDDGYATKDGDIQFIAAARTDVPALVAEVRRLRASAHHQLRDAEETHRMQLAAISCAAFANTVDGIAARLRRENPYWTDSYAMVCAMVDREVRERTRAEKAEADLAECYRITGADPDGNDDAMLARKAVDAVRRLRAAADHEGEKSEEWERCYRALEAGVGDALRDGLPCNIHIKAKLGDRDECRGCRAEKMLRSLLAKGGGS